MEHSQLSSTVTSQTYEGHSYQRRHIQSEYEKLLCTLTALQSNSYCTILAGDLKGPPLYCTNSVSIILFQNFLRFSLYFLLEGSSGHGRPASSLEYNQLPSTAGTQFPSQMYKPSQTQSE